MYCTFAFLSVLYICVYGYVTFFYYLLQIYRILGKTVVCYPIIFDLSDFYMSQDVLLLIDDIKVASECLLIEWDDFVSTDFIVC